MEDRDKKYLLEAILFLSGEPVTLPSLKDVTEMQETELKRLMDELMAEYKERNGGVLITEIANGYQMITNTAYAPFLKKFRAKSAVAKLSASALETLAIIAYRQPIIKAEIEQLRSVNSDGVVKTLLDRNLVKILGKKKLRAGLCFTGLQKSFCSISG